MPDPTTVPQADAQPFMEWLLAQRRGGLHHELTEQLAAVVRQVSEHRKKGQLTLVITIEPNKAAGALNVTDDVRVKAPAAVRETSLFFADDDGRLLRRPPGQMEIQLQEVPKPASAETGAA